MAKEIDTASQPAASSVLALIALALASVWVGAVAVVFLASVPHNPLAVSTATKTVVRLVAPEGWAFFTRSPREPGRDMLLRSGADWTSASLAPVAQATHAFGLDRRVRAQGVEVGILLGYLNKSAWTSCDEAPEICLNRASVIGPVTNPSPEPTLCGDVGIVLQDPLPWAWRRRQALIMPSKVTRLTIECDASVG